MVYECPLAWDGTPATWIPYYEITYDENNSIEYIFTNGDTDVLTNKEKFKERIKDIIYNPNVIIYDNENEY